MQVELTKADIDFGQKAHPSRCPVARAIRRACNERYYISVGLTWATFFKDRGLRDETIVTFSDLPPEVKRFIADFDLGRPTLPFTFELPDVVEHDD